ncbi:lysine transporter LysE [Methanocella sp. CWC-04]|uniref:Lysine transporter LysE n=1 Tax=Methanooceanicella nereidis TaxID=2052831 RepID=A0AAP2RAX8_9EURY|nr:LysE family transporter [Methanocella sp. CWC-04]MCD1293799.1 lysine transporter LysE [Methanocella sp. CWC-04]
MSEIYSLIAGLIIGLSLAVPPGPMNAVIAAESVKRSYVNGIKLGLGAMTADGIFLVITLIGVAILFTGDAVRMIVSAAGGLILGYMAIMTLKSYKEPLKEKENGVMRYPYIVGLTMGLTNPTQVLWWITAGAALISYFNEFGVIGFFIGILVWVTALSLLMHYASKKINGIYPYVILASGICILFFGILLLYNAAGIALTIF